VSEAQAPPDLVTGNSLWIRAFDSDFVESLGSVDDSEEVQMTSAGVDDEN